KAYVADRLDGKWEPLAASKDRPFAGPGNARHAGAHWTDSFSHGELIRTGHDERLEVDPDNLRFLFQGVSDAARKGKKYGEIPWRPGFLEPVKVETLDDDFFVKPADVKRRLQRPEGERRLAFAKHDGKYEEWRKRCKEKLGELLNVPTVKPCAVKKLRQTT